VGDSDPNRLVEARLKEIFAGRERLSLLEAGCGARSHINLPNLSFKAGIDISQRQLDRNRDLDQKILGDVQVYPLDQRAYDLIICWDLLEHLDMPLEALENLFRALKAGGALILAFPNLCSLKGLLTKATPFAVHAFFYRYIIGHKRKEDFDQFPTFFHSSIIPERVAGFARSRGLQLDFFLLYEGPVQAYLRSRFPLADLFFASVSAISRCVSQGRWDANHSDCLMILNKPADGSLPGAIVLWEAGPKVRRPASVCPPAAEDHAQCFPQYLEVSHKAPVVDVLQVNADDFFEI